MLNLRWRCSQCVGCALLPLPLKECEYKSFQRQRGTCIRQAAERAPPPNWRAARHLASAFTAAFFLRTLAPNNPCSSTEQVLWLLTIAACARATALRARSMLEGLRTLGQRLLSESSFQGAGVQGLAAADGATASPAAAARRLLAWITGGRAGRGPVLPVRKPKTKSSSPSGSPPGSRRQLQIGGRPSLHRLLRAALLLLVLAAAAACTAAASAALYYRSIIYEPADALAAATAEVQQALRAAEAAAVWPAGAPPALIDDLKLPEPAAIDVLHAADDPPVEEQPPPPQLWTANYTGARGGNECLPHGLMS